MNLCMTHSVLVAYRESIPRVADNQTTRGDVRVCWEGGRENKAPKAAC